MLQDESVIDLARSAMFRIGVLEVDPPLRRVSTGETLEPRVLQVLVALARADGAVVSRDALIASCWDGRIVGDDSITRVIGRLRKLAEDFGEGAFRIETVPKVGYRLVGTVEPVTVVAPPPSSASSIATAPVQSLPLPDPRLAAAPPRRWVVPALAAAGVAAVIGVAAVWQGQRGGDAPVMVQYAGYKRLDAGVSAALPDAIADATRSAFTEDGQVAVTSRASGDFRLSGSLARAGDIVRVAARIDDTRSGVTLWSRVLDVPPPEQAHLATRTAATTVQLARCALSQQAVHGKPLGDAVLTLMFAQCAAENATGDLPRALDLARRITEVQPDLASGWSSRAMSATIVGSDSPPEAAADFKAEARMAAAKALALDPRDSRAWHTRVYLVDQTDLVGIDRAYRAALAARPSECGCVYAGYGRFLLSVGRAGEALAMFRRARDTVPLHGAPLAGIGRILAGTGRIDAARQTFAELAALVPQQRLLADVVVSNSLWTRDYGEALRLMDRTTMFGPPALKAAAEGGLRALASGDAADRRAAATEMLRQTAACNCIDNFNLRMVAALGDARGAFAGLAVLALKYPFDVREPVAWDPIFAGVRREPGFPALAQRVGLLRYWRETRTRPDFCRAGNAPPICATI